MGFPSIDKSFVGTIRDILDRISALERRRSAAQPTPTGAILAFAGATGSVPDGWLLCDGTVVSRTVYANLFALVGTVYGAGDGFTTFALPNFRGSVPVGLDVAQSEFDTLGEVGGSKTHSHFEMVGYDGNGFFMRPEGQSPGTKVITTSRGLLTPGAATSASARFNRTETDTTLQPYVVVNYIIRA